VSISPAPVVTTQGEPFPRTGMDTPGFPQEVDNGIFLET
jgi:hypothetical protein